MSFVHKNEKVQMLSLLFRRLFLSLSIDPSLPSLVLLLYYSAPLLLLLLLLLLLMLLLLLLLLLLLMLLLLHQRLIEDSQQDRSCAFSSKKCLCR